MNLQDKYQVDDLRVARRATTTRVGGHALEFCGRPYNEVGRPIGDLAPFDTSGPGCGKCSCGALSPRLPSATARRRWHRDHKLTVLAERAS